jgi:hypothetical protein
MMYASMVDPLSRRGDWGRERLGDAETRRWGDARTGRE